MLAFAANSLLCRLAIGPAHAIDPVSFTSIRLVSGALALWLLVRLRRGRAPAHRAPATGSWRSGAALFAYALGFSLAYVSLEAGVGALILFGAVQVTMLGIGLLSGERPVLGEWIGFVVAVSGLVYLVAPGVSAPPLAGSLLMAIAGLSWGLYSLWGRGAANPITQTAGNFLHAVPMTVAASVFALREIDATSTGVLLAVISGALTSGLGYVIWYAALRGHTATSAAIVQLSVPVLAALGGVALLDETITRRLVVASVLTLGGVAGAILARARSGTPGDDAPDREP
jgi:drug/metabolite transporter (DMT)-like permease